MTVLIVAQGVAILLLGLLVAGLLRSHADIIRRLHDLGASVEGTAGHDADFAPTAPSSERPEATAHDVSGTTPGGDAIGVRIVGVTNRTLLAFLSSGCLSCAEFWEAFAGVGEDDLDGTRLVIVTKSEAEESPTRIGDLAPATHPVIMSEGAWADYLVPGSPYFVLVDGPAGRIVGEGSAGTWDQLLTLIAQATGDTGRRRGRRKARADARREDRADQELMAAGIHPGDPSLYENPEQPE